VFPSPYGLFHQVFYLGGGGGKQEKKKKKMGNKNKRGKIRVVGEKIKVNW